MRVERIAEEKAKKEIGRKASRRSGPEEEIGRGGQTQEDSASGKIFRRKKVDWCGCVVSTTLFAVNGLKQSS